MSVVNAILDLLGTDEHCLHHSAFTMSSPKHENFTWCSKFFIFGATKKRKREKKKEKGRKRREKRRKEKKKIKGKESKADKKRKGKSFAVFKKGFLQNSPLIYLAAS